MTKSALIEFQVELNPIPMRDQKSKDITVNWKMYNNFTVGNRFWTDSNGLEMEERSVVDMGRTDRNIAANYFPVTSAIAVRDKNSNV